MLIREIEKYRLELSPKDEEKEETGLNIFSIFTKRGGCAHGKYSPWQVLRVTQRDCKCAGPKEGGGGPRVVCVGWRKPKPRAPTLCQWTLAKLQ